MKKMLFLYLLLFVTVTVYSQDEMKIDVVYLKDKKVFRGNILKNEMGIVELLVKENGQEEILKFQRFEIKKIEQETVSVAAVKEKNTLPNVKGGSQTDPNTTGVKKGDDELVIERQVFENVVSTPIYTSEINYRGQGLARKMSGSSNLGNPYRSLPPRRVPKIWVRDIRGFRGFLEVGYMMGIGDNKYSYFEISKSVGFQFNPYVYMGVGVSMHLSHTHEAGYPLFFNPRFNLTDRNDWNPFISLKTGYAMGDTKGWNFGVTAGSSFVFGKNGKFAFNAGLAYTYFRAKTKEFDRPSAKWISNMNDFHSIGIKLEFEY